MYDDWIGSGDDKEALKGNLVGAKSYEDLKNREKKIVSIYKKEFKLNPLKPENGDFNYQYLKEIHKYIFGQVYDWAGQDRYNIGLTGIFRKDNTCFVEAKDIPNKAELLFSKLKENNYLLKLNKNKLISETAIFMNKLNMLHPFKEGNGRTQRLFVEQLFANSGYFLNLNTISKSTSKKIAIEGSKGNISGYEDILRRNCKYKF